MGLQEGATSPEKRARKKGSFLPFNGLLHLEKNTHLLMRKSKGRTPNGLRKREGPLQAGGGSGWGSSYVSSPTGGRSPPNLDPSLKYLEKGINGAKSVYQVSLSGRKGVLLPISVEPSISSLALRD